MHIIPYLQARAEELTNRSLPKFRSMDEFLAWRKQKQEEFHRMLGLDHYLKTERTSLNVHVTDHIDEKDYRVEMLHYESLPGLYVTGNLYVPKGLTEKAPAILYLCGHSLTQKVNYQEHARRFAQLGFVTLIIDTIQLGEVRGEHHGTYSRGWFDWVSKGYTPSAIEAWNAIRGLDFLCEHSDVDPQRLGVTGHSGGGTTTWWTICADDRVKAAAASSGTGQLDSHLRHHTLDRHCDCTFQNNPYGWSTAEVYALAVPRPMLILAPEWDYVFQIDSVRRVYHQLNSLYDQLNAAGNLKLFTYPSAHQYTPASRKQIFSWFLTHLTDKPAEPEEIADFDGFHYKEEQLLVYHGNLPENDRSLTVQDWFIPLPKPYAPESEAGLIQRKKQLKEKLLQDSFNAFPAETKLAQLTVEQKIWHKNGHWQHTFRYNSEEHWHLQGEIRGAQPDPSEESIGLNRNKQPLIIHLRPSGDERLKKTYELSQTASEEWLKARIDVRGTGDTSWGSELDWHVRRASALLGCTVSSMRVWDTLRGIEAMRQLPYVDSKQIVLAGNGEMAVVALLAALLDGGLAGILLKQAPDTLNAPDNQDALHLIEIINLLRHTDLPEIAACLWPMKLAFVEDLGAFEWTKEVYENLGGSVQQYSNASDIDFAPFLNEVVY